MNDEAFRAAVREFNEAFGYILDPDNRMTLLYVADMVNLARWRGRDDIADKLQLSAEVIL